MKNEERNINILYMTEEQINLELIRIVKYINGMQFNAIVIDKDNMKFVIILN